MMTSMSLQRIEVRRTKDLQPHPQNTEIYRDGASQDLVDSIAQKGVLNPLLITEAGIVISGHRRWDAAKSVGIDVPCVIYPSTDDLDILEALVESNRQREKTNEQIGREFAVLKDIYHQRQSRQGARTDIDGTSVERSTEVPNPAREAASFLGVSYDTAHEASQTVAAIDALEADGRGEDADELRGRLNQSTHGAFTEAKSKGYIAPKAPKEDAKPKPTILLKTYDGADVAYPEPQGKPTFNQTNGEGISWARWSWNPVTGCLHGCPYCYAREIATQDRTRASYPAGFTPLFHHERLTAPANTSIPESHADDSAWRRVFVCSMADLYGNWVPDEWIQKVHASMLASPKWEYLLLTKYPKRYVGLDLPPLAWVGTSVDEQKRVKLAEDAFRQINGVAVKWLSLEPLREPLKFNDLSMFDWVVIGAQTSTIQPDGRVESFAPPFEWVADIVRQARDAGCKIHQKPNLSHGPGMEMLNEYPA